MHPRQLTKQRKKPLLGWLRAVVVRWCEAHGVKDPAEVALGAVMDDAGICAPLQAVAAVVKGHDCLVCLPTGPPAPPRGVHVWGLQHLTVG